MQAVHTTLEEYENGGFNLKTRQIFFVHTTLDDLKNATITDHFGFVIEEIFSGKSRDYCDVIVFKKLRFQNVIRPNENEKAVDFKFLRFEECFRKSSLS